METFAIVLLVLCFGGLGISLYFLNRNRNVAAFLSRAFEISFHGNDEELYEWAKDVDVPSVYRRVLYSTRPLKYENFFPEWVAKRLNELADKI